MSWFPFLRSSSAVFLLSNMSYFVFQNDDGWLVKKRAGLGAIPAPHSFWCTYSSSQGTNSSSLTTKHLISLSLIFRWMRSLISSDLRSPVICRFAIFDLFKLFVISDFRSPPISDPSIFAKNLRSGRISSSLKNWSRSVADLQKLIFDIWKIFDLLRFEKISRSPVLIFSI